MKTISKPGDNLGGLTKLWAIPYDVFSVSGQSVTISDDSNVYAIYCTPESMEFSEPIDNSDAGIHYNTVVNGFIPGNTAANQEAIEYMERRKWAVLFKDGNGNYKMAGSRVSPLRFKADLLTGKDTIGLAGYNFSFSGKTIERAVFVTNPF